MPRLTWIVTLASIVLPAQELSRAKEDALGANLLAHFTRDLQILAAPRAQAYTQAVVKELAPILPGTRHVLITRTERNSRHEPVTLPGGYLLIPATLLLNARSDIEFAAMIAHAMAHLTAQHGLRRVSTGQVGDATIPLVYVGGWVGTREDLIPRSLRSQLVAQEVEADAMAASALSDFMLDSGALPPLAAAQDEVRALAPPSEPTRVPPTLRR